MLDEPTQASVTFEGISPLCFACEIFHKLLFFEAEMANDPSPEGPVDPRRKDADPLAALRKPSSGIGSMGAAGKYAGLGFQFVGAILLFLWIGQWVDRKLGTDGIFLILGVFLGAGAAFYSMYRNLMADQKRDEAEALAAKQAKAEQDRRSQEKQ